MPPATVIPDIWKNALSLCAAGWGWLLLTQWGNSESSFFGVRVDNKFEDGPEAGEIFSRYRQEIIALTIALVIVSTLQQWLFQRQLPSTYVFEFLCLELLQALGVRVAYWKARNRTLPFAAQVDSVQIADFASLNPPSLVWKLFYWPGVYLPLIAISALAVYLHYHWTSSPFSYAVTFPVSESSPPIAWSLNVLVRAYWSVIAAILLDVAGVLVAIGFSFHIRVNEWGDDDAELELSQTLDDSYRRGHLDPHRHRNSRSITTPVAAQADGHRHRTILDDLSRCLHRISSRSQLFSSLPLV